MSTDKLTRRKLLGMSIAAFGGTSIGYLTTRQAEGTNISLQATDFSIPDTEYMSGGDSLEAITINVQAEFEYSSTHALDGYRITLLLGDSDTTITDLDIVEETGIDKSSTGSETLSGPIDGTYHFEVSDFEPSNGGSQSTVVYVGLRFELLQEGETIAEKEVIETPSVTVDATELSTNVTLGGTGNISVDS
jgi:hypothetical protein